MRSPTTLTALPSELSDPEAVAEEIEFLHAEIASLRAAYASLSEALLRTVSTAGMGHLAAPPPPPRPRRRASCTLTDLRGGA